MITDSQLDELFKNRLARHRSPVPEDMWERIIQKKDKDRKGFFFLFRLFGLFILSFSIVGLFLLKSYTRSAIRGKQETSNNKTISIPNTIQFKRSIRNFIRDLSPKYKRSGTNDPIHNKHLYENNPMRFRAAENNLTGMELPQPKQDSETRLNEVTISIDSNMMDEDKVKSASIPNRKPSSNDTTQKAVVNKMNKTKTRKDKKWWLDLYASPDYPIISEKEGEKMNLSYTVGIKLNRSFGRRFSGKTGIQFSQINYSLMDTTTRASLNHLKSIDFPVLAGYSLGNETFGMTIDAGAVFNLYSWFQGGSPNYFKTNTGLSLYLGVNLEKHLNERMAIFMEPYYRYRLTSMTTSTVDFNKFIDAAGLSLGVRFYFKK